MYKLGEAPSPRADVVQLADFLEVECLRQTDRNASIQDVLSDIGRLSDDFETEAAESDADRDSLVAAVLAELVERQEDSGLGTHRYAFDIDTTRAVLHFR